MPEILTSMNLTGSEWALAFLCAILVGFAKTGITGTGILIVPLMASLFPAKASVGILLPMLCIADFFAVKYYHRHADWKLMLKPMPWAVGGILIGVWVGKGLDSDSFRYIIGGLVLAILVFMIIRERYTSDEKIP
ncbi:MAG: sulfite exporter TauE/SafE family protein, partial [Planctomycetota bacterium]